MPSRRAARTAMIAVSVRRATATAGSRNAATPLLTASTPVMAVQPLANALASTHSPATAAAAGGVGGGSAGAGWPPAATAFHTPTPITPSSATTNRYVGTASTAPDSLTPRRLTTAIP